MRGWHWQEKTQQTLLELGGMVGATARAFTTSCKQHVSREEEGVQAAKGGTCTRLAAAGWAKH